MLYGTNNEFGFDYLRDNMKFSKEQMVQRDLNFGIIDEVDNILIDEARTPLIISGPAEESTDKYYKVNKLVPSLKKEEHYTIDEKARTASLTEEGIAKMEKDLNIENLYDPANIETLHCLNQAVKAHGIFKNEVDYVVRDGEVIIIDEFTGRMMNGRRYSDGLHQALEAKEGVNIENENQTLASITFQNYFRMYQKLAGMTGTADTEAEEFMSIYKLEVVVVPTNRPMIREDHPDVIYRTEKEKFNAVIEEIRELNEISRPVLVGTISIEKSELLSKKLKKYGIKHNVLNAKHHEKEAEIISQAGQPNAVTIATNMAGRGTDIVLGEGIPELGGLHILGTERHESRRIDNQLRGRSGRQGDKGSSRFFLCLEDDLLRIFGSDKISPLMARLGMEDGQPIEHSMVSKAVANAQRKVEAHNFDIRKHVLEYDDVMNRQREVLYALRREIIHAENPKEILLDMADELVDDIVSEVAHEKVYPEEWDIESLNDFLERQFGVHVEKINEKELEIQKLSRLEVNARSSCVGSSIIDAPAAKYLHPAESGDQFLESSSDVEIGTSDIKGEVSSESSDVNGEVKKGSKVHRLKKKGHGAKGLNIQTNKSGNNVNLGQKMSATMPPSSSGYLYSSDDDVESNIQNDTENKLSPEEIQAYEQENEAMYEDLMSLRDNVEQIENKVVKIAQLQEIFTCLLYTSDAADE